MRFFRIVLVVAFLCVGLPTNGQRYSKIYHGAVHRQLRAYESIEETEEERGLGDKIAFNLNKFSLGSNVEAALKNPKMAEMWKQVEAINSGRTVEKQMILTRSLMKKYGDDALLTAIRNADNVAETKAVATRLGSELLLNHARIFKGTQYQDKNILEVLTKALGENKVLQLIAATRQKAPSTAKVEELRGWETTLLVQKLESQMQLVGMDGTLKTLLKSPLLESVNNYIMRVEAVLPHNHVSFLRILRAKYSDDEIAKRLVVAKGVGSSKSIASDLETQLFSAWWREHKSVDDVFELLKMKNLQENVFTSRGMQVIDGYLSSVEPIIRRQEKTLMGVLSRGFKGEDKLAIILTNVKVNGERFDEAAKTKAAGLQNRLFQQWWREGVDSTSKAYTTKFKVAETAASDAQIRAVSNFEEFLTAKMNNAANVARRQRK